MHTTQGVGDETPGETAVPEVQMIMDSLPQPTQQVQKLFAEVTPRQVLMTDSVEENTQLAKNKRRRVETCAQAEKALARAADTTVKLYTEGPSANVVNDVVGVLCEVTKVLKMVVDIFQQEPSLGNGEAAATNNVQAVVARNNLSKKTNTKKPQEMAKPKKQTLQKILSQRPVQKPPTAHSTTMKAPPTIGSTPQTWSAVLKKNLLGSRKDNIDIVAPEQEWQTTGEVTLLPESEIKLMTREPRIPQTHQITVLRFPNMPSRKDMPAKAWRSKLATQNIKVHSILFPAWGVIELVAPKTEEPNIRKFFKSLNREPEKNPSPFAIRKEGAIALTQETIEFLIKNRIQMMKYEGSIVALRYLTQCVRQGIMILGATKGEKLEKELQEVTKKLRL